MISELTCKKCQAFMRIFLILGLHPISNEFPSQSFRNDFTTETQRARSFLWGTRAHTLRRIGRRRGLLALQYLYAHAGTQPSSLRGGFSPGGREGRKASWDAQTRN